MTCWPLRNLLLRLFWADAEGCISHIRHDYWTGRGGSDSSLYAQCIYLASNQSIAAYVRYLQFFLLQVNIAHKECLCRTFSVQLSFLHAPKDLMTKFVDCLARLPNLKTLEILSVSSRAPISKALQHKYAVFPSIRELRITPVCHNFIRNCPNLEHLTFTSGVTARVPATIHSHGKRLKRVAGVGTYCWSGAHGELVNKPSSPCNHSEAHHSGLLGLPEPSGDWHCW